MYSTYRNCECLAGEEVQLHTVYMDTAHWSITPCVLYTKCRLSRHGQVKALSLSLLTCASPLLLAKALKGSVHMMSDLNAGTMSQAKLQITALTDDTFFATCNSPSIKEVWFAARIYRKNLVTQFELIQIIYRTTDGHTIHIYKMDSEGIHSTMWGSLRLAPMNITQQYSDMHASNQ